MASENSKQYVYPNKYLQACIEKEREEEEELCNHAPCRRCLVAIESNTDDQTRELKVKIKELELALKVERTWAQKVLEDMSKTAKALAKVAQHEAGHN